MTPEQLAKLSPDQKNFAVAIIWGGVDGSFNPSSRLGYFPVEHSEELYNLGCLDDGADVDEKPDHVLAKCPYFVGNLNAAAYVEASLDDPSHKRFRIALWNLTTDGPNDGYEKVSDEQRRAFVSATAEQRTDAILLSQPV